MAIYTPQRTLTFLQKTPVILNHLFHDMTTERAKQLAPGITGWSGLEVVCHLVDLEEIFTVRVRRMLSENKPAFGYTWSKSIFSKCKYWKGFRAIFSRILP